MVLTPGSRPDAQILSRCTPTPATTPSSAPAPSPTPGRPLYTHIIHQIDPHDQPDFMGKAPDLYHQPDGRHWRRQPQVHQVYPLPHGSLYIDQTRTIPIFQNQYQYQYLEWPKVQYQYQYQYLAAAKVQYQFQYQYLENWDFNTNTNTNTGQNTNTSIPIPILATNFST